MGMAGTRRATAVALLSLATCARAYLLTPSRRTARCAPLRMQDAPPTWEPPSVPLQHVQPSPSLTPRDVVNSVMAALHRTNWDTPTPFYGFEVALRSPHAHGQGEQRRSLAATAPCGSRTRWA